MVGVWWGGSDRVEGSGRGGGGVQVGGRLHSKVWTDTHLYAKGF